LRVRLWLAGGRLEQFLSHDRPPEGVQRRVEVERQLACLLTLDGGRTLRLEGRADRLDWHDGRLFRVVDYKTGGMPVTRSARSLADLALLGLPDLEGRELCQALAGYRRALPHLQILLYLLMAGETFHVDPASLQASYACPVQGRGTWIHWPDSEEDRVSVAGALEVLRGLVGEAATDIMTRAVWWPVEDPRICVYCPYQGICRPCLN